MITSVDPNYITTNERERHLHMISASENKFEAKKNMRLVHMV